MRSSNKIRPIKVNILMNVILTLSSILFPLLTFPYVSRILLPTGTGKVAFATSFISYFSLFSQLGIPTYGIRACAKVRDDKTELSRTVQELLIINLVMCALVYVVFFFVVAFIPHLREERVLYYVVSLSILFNAIGMDWLYRGLEQYTYITIRSVAFKFVAVVAMLILVRTKDDYVIYGALTIFAASASNIANLLHAHHFITFQPEKPWCFRRHLKAITIFFAMSCATTIYTHMDTVMLGFMAGAEEVGLYDAAVKIKVVLVSLTTAFGAVLLPRASYYVQQDNMKEFWRLTNKAMQFVLFMALPLIVYFTLYAPQCILILSGPAYGKAVVSMRIILPTVLLIGMTNILGIQILVPLGKEKVVLYSEISGAIVNVIVNALLIPHFMAAGAAIGTVIAETVVFLIQFSALREHAKEVYVNIKIMQYFLGIIMGALAILTIKRLEIHALFSLVLSACLFFGVYYGYLIMVHEKLAMELWKQACHFLRRRGN